MSLFRIVRVEGPPDDLITLICDDPGQVVAKVTVEDTTTGVQSTVQTCYDPEVDPCDTHGLIGSMHLSYEPADWDEECGYS